MASGITASDSCIAEYDKFKLQNNQRDSTKRSFLLFKINDGKVQLCEEGKENASWEDFVERLTSKEKDGCYGIYDYEIEYQGGRQPAKEIVFVAWVPDNMPVKLKMIYASAKQPFKTQLGSGLKHVINASDLSDLDGDSVREMVLKGR